MGTVWAARDQVLGRDVAVKEVIASTDSYRERAERRPEAHAA
jgi:hypothetical protein